MHSSRQLVADSVNALYHQGATVSVIHTRKVIDMTDLGYVITLDGEIIPRRAKTVPMVRIINAEAILRQMPAGKRDGAFVLEVVDEQIPANNARWLITCQDGEKTIVEANRDWDIQLPIAVLTRIVYGTQTFADFLECNAGYRVTASPKLARSACWKAGIAAASARQSGTLAPSRSPPRATTSSPSRSSQCSMWAMTWAGVTARPASPRAPSTRNPVQ